MKYCNNCVSFTDDEKCEICGRTILVDCECENFTVKKSCFLSSNGKNIIHGEIYIPKKPPIGIIQISHGMCEYIGRYYRFMKTMADIGFVVGGNDHLGHGSSATPDTCGYFAHKNGYKYVVEDLHRFTIYLKKLFPNLPCILLGHSMGSFISRIYSSDFSNDINGLILSGTGGKNPFSKLGIFIASMVGHIKGEFYRSKCLDNIAFGDFNKSFVPKITDKDWLTRDSKIVNKFILDPKCMFVFTASGFHDLSTMSYIVNRYSWYRNLNKYLPIFIISGKNDPVGKNGKGVLEVYNKIVKSGAKNIDIKLYENARHEILNEINYKEVYSDIVRWIENNCL